MLLRKGRQNNVWIHFMEKVAEVRIKRITECAACILYDLSDSG